MKTSLNVTVISIILILLCCPTGSPTSDGRVSLLVTIAPPEGPLRIVGLRLPEQVGDPSKAIVHSNSTKEIRDFILEAVVGNAREGQNEPDPRLNPLLRAPESMSFRWGERGEMTPRLEWRDESRAVPPNGLVEIHHARLNSPDLARLAAKLHSDCLHVTAHVREVYFADGTIWESDLKVEQMREMWKSTFRPESPTSCENPPLAEDVVSRIEGDGYQLIRGSPTHADAGVVQFYQVSCQLRTIEGKLIAMCPW